MPTGTLPKPSPAEPPPPATPEPEGFTSGPGGGPNSPGGDGDYGGWNPMGWRTPPAASRAGIQVALVSVSMLFASLTLFFLERRALGAPWPRLPFPKVLYLNTLVLLASSAAFERAWRALSADRLSAFRAWLYATLGLGVAFVGGQWLAWRSLAAAGVYLKGNPSSAFFYFVTGAHALHLAGGLAALAYLAFRARELRWGLRRRTVVEVTRLYWHFMDGLWVYLFVVMLALYS